MKSDVEKINWQQVGIVHYAHLPITGRIIGSVRRDHAGIYVAYHNAKPIGEYINHEAACAAVLEEHATQELKEKEKLNDGKSARN